MQMLYHYGGDHTSCLICYKGSEAYVAGEFMAALTAAIFRLHQLDKDAVIQKLQLRGKSLEEIRALPPSYFKEM
jgi:hypothetical protein